MVPVSYTHLDVYKRQVHSTDMYPADSEVGIFVKPFNIQIMHKPESEDEKAVDINE